MPKPFRRGGGNSGGLSWVKKQEPKFIREFKERIVYKEQSNVETKKKKVDEDLMIEKDEDRPQIVQLKSGDLGEKEYMDLKSKEEIINGASSFGKILFKKPQKKGIESSQPTTSEEAKSEEKIAVKKSEIDLIFDLNEDGTEKQKEEDESENIEANNSQPVFKKKYLGDEDEEQAKKYGIQEGGPPIKKRFVDKQTTKVTNISAKKVLERESKAGNKKMLSFYDEEEEEKEEYEREDFNEKNLKDDDNDSD